MGTGKYGCQGQRSEVRRSKEGSTTVIQQQKMLEKRGKKTQEEVFREGEMALWLRVLAVLSKDLSLDPSTYIRQLTTT